MSWIGGWAIIWDSVLTERVIVFPREGEDGGFLCVFLCDMRLNFSLLYLFFLGLGFACLLAELLGGRRSPYTSYYYYYY